MYVFLSLVKDILTINSKSNKNKIFHNRTLKIKKIIILKHNTARNKN